ncbi:hypothetical protein [uncultured Roseobacter sp.]|uniref:hypothetical protein n=1 Tax=uncultured Roseobacter sp. TaxID=114847 RepID=UPI002628FD2D|nr:hypothetical protein [uncultured Roseobacter sp.]
MTDQLEAAAPSLFEMSLQNCRLLANNRSTAIRHIAKLRRRSAPSFDKLRRDGRYPGKSPQWAASGLINDSYLRISAAGVVRFIGQSGLLSDHRCGAEPV